MLEVSNLVGNTLHYWVGRAMGWVNYPTDSIEHGNTWHCNPKTAPFGPTMYTSEYTPSTDLYQCETIMVDHIVKLIKSNDSDGWYAYYTDYDYQHGTTIQEAICRAFVSKVYGDCVEDDVDMGSDF